MRSAFLLEGGSSIVLMARNASYRRQNGEGKATMESVWLKKRKVLAPNVFMGIKIVIAQVLVLLIIHHGRTTSMENACSSHTICSSRAAGAGVLSLGRGSGAVTAVAGCEVGGSVVPSSPMKGQSKLIDSLTPLQGLQTRVRAHPTGEVVNLFNEHPYWPLHILPLQLRLTDNEFSAL